MFEVNLSLDEPSCGCGEYAITLAVAFFHPCKPGLSGLPEELADYADPHFRMKMLAKVYKEVIVPCAAGRDLLPDRVTLPIDLRIRPEPDCSMRER